MKILFSVEEFNPPIGGAETFTHELINKLSEKHEVYILFAGKKKENVFAKQISIDRKKVFKHIPLINKTWIRYYYANKAWEKILERYVKEIKPDLIFTQLVLSPASVKIARKHGIKSLIYLHNYEHFCPSIFFGKNPMKDKDDWKKYLKFHHKIQLPYILKLKKMFEKSMKETDEVIANSQYIADVAKYYYNIKPRVLFPVINLEQYIYKRNSKKYITFINPIKNKGVELFIKIAKKMNNKKFLVVGGATPDFIEEVKKLNNVTYKPWIDDMEEVYSNTKLLLVPSIWYEPFGRVVLEAQINSIPVISSGRGGLKEAVGEGGIIIKDIDNINNWINSIKKLDTKKTYNNLSFKAKIHAEKYISKKQINRFYKIINSIIKNEYFFY